MNAPLKSSQLIIDAWNGFTAGDWQQQVDVRDFIQQNFTPYAGDDSFLAGPTPRTEQLWQTLSVLLKQEREKGVLDVSAEVGSSITAHNAGYIDQDLELRFVAATRLHLAVSERLGIGLRTLYEKIKRYGFE